MTREEAIELLEDLNGAIEDNQGRDYDEAFRMAIEALSAENSNAKTQNSNQETQMSKAEWIPCSERLPEEFSVLCCDTYGEMLIAHPFECNDSDIGFSAESDECYMYNCIAWMPLPKPYKGGDNE